MNSRLTDFIEEGMALTPDEREIAALALTQVNETEQARVDAAWRDEIATRVDEIINGDVTVVNGQETIALARALIDKHSM